MEAPSQLALVISDLGSGGAQKVLVQLAKSWDLEGRCLTVITLAGPEHDFFSLPAGVRRVVIGGVAKSRNVLTALHANWRRVLRLRRALRETGAPIVVGFVAQTAVLTVLASIRLPIRVIVAERNDPRRQNLGLIWNALRRFAYTQADLVTANSRGVANSLADFVVPKRVAFLPNPLPSPPHCQPAKLTAPTILSIGRLSHQKAHDVLLAAFMRFSAKQTKWRLAIMGEGPEDANLRELAVRLGLAGKVDWLGRQDSPYPFLRASRIFVLASRHEGMPNALLEAMSCALPCIVSGGSPGPLELVQDRVSGLVVPVDDSEALADAMQQLAADDCLAKALGEKARERAKAYGLDAVIKLWNEVLGLDGSGIGDPSKRIATFDRQPIAS